ncbi:hypothetical protein [Thalassotalea castellviae]|uniref:Uncharacterized protein n=1 Tax=Thalassotalea castellviae TaxID=3075612 RepID=A0ABU3A5C6_9GAMM|nr:hypothetical protein [Thalassotalea sp. W431]MDT0605377.1 hypothetical protein [Thalassotalea sp. W431]
MELLKKIWKDPVGSKIIATVLTAGFVWLLSKIQLINEFFIFIINKLTAFITIPIWFFTVLLTVSISFVIKLLMDLRISYGNDKYTSDYIEGLSWEWKYSGSKISELKPLCPQCKHEIIQRDIRQLGYSHQTKEEFYCEGCNFTLAINDKPVYEYYSRINRHIERKLRTKEWRKNKPNKPINQDK